MFSLLCRDRVGTGLRCLGEPLEKHSQKPKKAALRADSLQTAERIQVVRLISDRMQLLLTYSGRCWETGTGEEKDTKQPFSQGLPQNRINCASERLAELWDEAREW